MCPYDGAGVPCVTRRTVAALGGYIRRGGKQWTASQQLYLPSSTPPELLTMVSRVASALALAAAVSARKMTVRNLRDS